MTGHTLIALRDVTRGYNGTAAIRAASLDLLEGSRVAIVGENGSGKSTLLRIITGVSLPTRGRRTVSETFEGSSLGYVPQAGGIYPDLTVRSNLALRCRIRGVRRPDGDIVDRLGLTPLLDRRAGDLSVGYRRLTAAACALSGQPDWVVMDEPFAGVDEANRQRLVAVLADLPLRLLVVADVTTPPPGIAGRIIQIREGRLP